MTARPAPAVAVRVIEANLRRYRHTWRSSVFSSFLNPLLFLVALGFGLGSLVRTGPGGVPYVTWLAPALIAATAMQTAAGESAYPVMAGIKWIKTYDAALSTPARCRDLAVGHIGWVLLRSLQVALVYAVIAAALGVMHPVAALATIPAAVLTGFAVGALVYRFTTGLERETGLSSLFRFGITPLFLFSGTFFPVSQLPGWLQPLAFLSPLWHGVELARSWAIGARPTLPWWLHAGMLVALGVAGAWAGARRLERRLVT